ncbi:hypothetical protein [Citromicrobium bathyomarinum]|uniref:hypothetical protein n=1 Tax=Citromicrobium bathyomarinum TaxID=72174 RepID=UPI001E557B92|nr:hypothetical protein [Citromicrobium bathyomarinum]MCD1623155.1 hypothetical protein [Citromicrobium bathyomarinum]
MRNRIIKTIPERMVVLSILPPPHTFEPLRPFGFGAFVCARHGHAEAKFALSAQGYGAGYDPQRIRGDIRALFTPETQALICMPDQPHARGRRIAKAQFPSSFFDLVPCVGLLSNVFAVVPRDILAHSAAIGRLTLSSSAPSPLQRVGQLSSEAQAAWVYWLFRSCAPHRRRNLLASHAAWQAIERARKSTTRVQR